MTEHPLPILYSFRRCPYAMRARLAIAVSATTCELREIVLRDKAPEFLAASPKGTVPVVVTERGDVVEESLDIMLWALERADPENWLQPDRGTRAEMSALIASVDTDFKANLDRYKYPDRQAGAQSDAAPGEVAEAARAQAARFLRDLDARLHDHPWLYGNRPALADMAILPFVRQFAHVDRAWFDGEDWPALTAWLDQFLASDRFTSIMTKYPQWHASNPVTLFPSPATAAENTRAA